MTITCQALINPARVCLRTLFDGGCAPFMEQFGLVTKTRDDTAVVSLQRHLSCESCGRCGILSGSGSKREIIVEALNPVNAEEGQRVLLETNDRQLLFISFMLYLVPLGGLLAGILAWPLLADWVGLDANRELPAVGLGLFFMFIIFVFIRIWDRKVKDNPAYKPVITGLLEAEQHCIDSENEQ